MRTQIYTTTPKMYVDDKAKFLHYSALNAFYRAVANGYKYECKHTLNSKEIVVEFAEGGHDYLVYMTPEEFSKCIVEGLNA
jgi:hypothetical protein